MKNIPSYCGIDCKTCEYKDKENCSGCKKVKGKVFWGQCQVASCCIEKELDNCGLCTDFPCKLLKKFAYDKEQGDNGKRIENLKKWN